MAQGQTFEMRLVNKGLGDLGLEVREISGAITPTSTDFFADLVFGIRWDSTYSDSMVSATGNYNIEFAGNRTRQGTYHYQAFYANNLPYQPAAAWNPLGWVEISTISTALTGSGRGTFEICPYGYAETTQPNLNLNGKDYTVIITGAATDVLLGISYTWIGGSGDDWSTPANWSSGVVPNEYQGVIIPRGVQGDYPSLSSDISIKEVELDSGATLNLNNHTLFITGSLRGKGLVEGTTQSSMVFTGVGNSVLNMMNINSVSGSLNSLTVDIQGNLTLGKPLGVRGIVNLNSGVLVSNGNLYLPAMSPESYGQISPLGKGSISGNLLIQKHLRDTSEGWREFSKPLRGAISALEGVKLLFKSHPVPIERNVTYWNASDTAGFAYGWNEVDSANSKTSTFAIYSNNGSNLQTIQPVISHTGTYSKTDFSFPLFDNLDPDSFGTSYSGWNLVGNPYPSNLSLTALFNSNFSGLDYKAVHVWDPVAQQYRAILANGAAIAGSNPTGGDEGIVSILAPFQAFWVKSSFTTSFSVPNSARVTRSDSLGLFLKHKLDLARLDVKDEFGGTDQTIVYFDESATELFDYDYDGYKLFSHNIYVPSLYSTDPDGLLSINARDINLNDHSIPLGIKSNLTGNFTYSLNTDDLDASWYVYLEDRDLDVMINLRDNDYTYKHEYNSDERFVLHFKRFATSTEKVVASTERIKIGGDGEKVFVYVPKHYQDQLYKVEVIDFSGRTVYSNTQVSMKAGMNTLNLTIGMPAYYAIRIEAAEGIESEKVYLR